jgi:hypothetical protein
VKSHIRAVQNQNLNQNQNQNLNQNQNPTQILIFQKSRTLSVRNYLIKKGVQKDRITTQGFGETKPIDRNDTPTGRENNRRIEFVIVN